jgi:hypothetical protein
VRLDPSPLLAAALGSDLEAADRAAIDLFQMLLPVVTEGLREQDHRAAPCLTATLMFGLARNFLFGLPVFPPHVRAQLAPKEPHAR